MSEFSFFSRDLGRQVTEKEVADSTDFYFLEDIESELSGAIADAKAELDHRKRRAAVYRDFMKPEQFNRLVQKHKMLGQFHQKVMRCKSRLRRQEAAVKAQVPPMEMFFYNAAKNMLPQPDFQRLVLIAEQRRGVASRDAERKSKEAA